MAFILIINFISFTFIIKLSLRVKDKSHAIVLPLRSHKNSAVKTANPANQTGFITNI
jgi:hypothetical protein